MAKAKKLPSGNWRAQAYSHKEPVIDSETGKAVIDPKTGKPKMRNVYESFTASNKAEAEFLASQFTLNKGTSNISDWTLQRAFEEFMKKRNNLLSPATIREYERSFRADFDFLRDKKISKITQEEIQQFVNMHALSKSQKTVRNIHGLLSTVLGTYRPSFALNTNLPSKTKTKRYIPSDAEVRQVIEYVHSHDKEMEKAIYLGAFGPMRRGEIAALKGKMVMSDHVLVEEARAINKNNKFVTKVTKTIAGYRKIYFPDYVMKLISGYEDDEYIVKLSPDGISHRFPHLLKNAGVHHFRFHDLRHYSASIQHALGVPDAYIMARGGWSDDRVLKEVYRHTLEKEEMKMNNKTNKHFESILKK